MATTTSPGLDETEQGKSELVERAAGLARSGPVGGGPPREKVQALLGAYYRHVAPEDLATRSEADVWGALASHHRLGQERPQATAQVRVLTPGVAEQGWSAGGRSVVEVVVDDMPFLVDSLQMELARQRRDVHLVIHPLFDVERDVAGRLHALVPVDDAGEPPAPDAVRESWMHLEVDRVPEAEVDDLVADLQRVLRDVRDADEDAGRMRERLAETVHALRAGAAGVPDEEAAQAADLLEWLAAEHFTFLGYREYELETDGDGEETLRAVTGTGLGILRGDELESESFARLPAAVRAMAHDPVALVLAKSGSRSTVHRPAYLDLVGIKVFAEDGEVTGERRFVGLFSSAAYTEALERIPVLREKARAVLRASGFDPRSHTGKALADTLETYPRDELFHTPAAELAPLVEAAMHARERRALRIFVRRDTYQRYLTVLVYLPRDRYTTTVRQRFADILASRIGGGRIAGDAIDFTVRIDSSSTARVHFTVRMAPGEALPEVDVRDLERRLAAASRSWRDDLLAAVVAEYGEEVGTSLGRRWADAFPEAYKEDFPARAAALDLARLEALTDAGGPGLDLALHEPIGAGPGEVRLKAYRVGEALSLSTVLPMLSSLGVEVVDERPYRIESAGAGRGPTYLYDFGLRHAGDLPARARELFTDALRAVWDGRSEVDGFNTLVLRAGLTWRQVGLLRAYARYQRQGGSPFGQSTIEDALVENAEIARLLVQAFEARFDPTDAGTDAVDPDLRERAVLALLERVDVALEEVRSLDHDRVLRSYRALVLATLRTNYFQRDEAGAPKPYLALKLDPAAIPDLPRPRPRFEIFVHSPRVEGVHLRFGSVARGGLRWSDRRDDYRTEVLGLVKAQMVKNTVIVPVGAKGGFFAKQLPPLDPARPETREAWLAEGVASYRTFICGLLDLTDNLVDGAVVAPADTVRHDGVDTYLVVAADKGTATFSDIANAVAGDYGFWLGDAFASGGSVGYDHKAMGITARGAWVSVQRHFRERGVDCQTEDFTCVGIGDMSGDVFGNGMLCSPHTRLVAAFDHRDVFLDPTPDAATSYAERQRLFALPRSSWADYDRSLVSKGGGVWPRTAKSVPVSPQVREALGLEEQVDHLTPAELVAAILKAPVDLLWNGGIGTYVKGAGETQAEAGDKANDAVRVDGAQVRARCVGEGGNLGLTQAGRIEYARLGGPEGTGGALDTDFIDNSAGVDTSDHEVNIKILLDAIVTAGDLTTKQRNAVLAEMTEEVAALVLRDNYEQNLALANAASHAPSLLHVHEEWMRTLESRGELVREVEGLPASSEVAARAERGEGLTTPELSVLMAWTKIVLARDLLEGELPDDPWLEGDLEAYFPAPVRERFAEQVRRHPLRREIITTQVVGDLVNGAGITFWPRLAGETGAGPADLTRANFVAREIFGSLPLRQQVAALDNRIDAAVQTRMRLTMRTLVERASRWLVSNRRPPLDSRATVEQFAAPVQALVARLPELLTGSELTAYDARREALLEQGVPEELAIRVAVLDPAYALLGVVETATREGLEPAEVARVHVALGERLGLPVLLARIASLPRDDRWQTMARAALRDDLLGVHTQLTAQVMARTAASEDPAARIADWEAADEAVVGRAVDTLAAICADDDADLARLSVGLRVVRGLLAP